MNSQYIDTEQSQKSKITFKTNRSNRTNKTNLTHFTKKTNASNKIVSNQQDNKSSHGINLTKKVQSKKNKVDEPLPELIDQFLLLLNIKDMSKLELVIEKMKIFAEYTYTDKIIPGYEYINDDDNSIAFDKFISYCKIAINNTKDFGLMIKDVLIAYSLVYNGKWSDCCFSLIIDLMNHINNIAFLEIVQKEIVAQIKFSLGKSYLTDHPFLLQALEQFISVEYLEITEFTFSRITYEVINKQINYKLLKKSMIKLHNEENNYDLIKNCFYLVTTIKTLEYLRKLIKNKKLLFILLSKNSLSVENIKVLAETFNSTITHYNTKDEIYHNPYYHEILHHISKIILSLLEIVNESSNNSSNNDHNKLSTSDFDKIGIFIKQGLSILVNIEDKERILNTSSSHSLLTEESSILNNEKKVFSLNPLKNFFSKKEETNANKNNNVIVNKKDKSHISNFLVVFILGYVSNRRFLLFNGVELLSSSDISKKQIENHNVSLLLKILMNLLYYDVSKFIELRKEFISILSNISSPINNHINEIPIILDPFLLEAYMYCIKFIFIHYKGIFIDKYDMFDYNLLIQFCHESKLWEKILNCMQLLNQNSSEYQCLLKYSEIYLKKEILKKYNFNYSFVYLSNKLVLKLFSGIISFLALMGKIGNKENKDRVSLLLEEKNIILNENNRDDYLIDCLSINSDILKFKVLEVFLHVNPREINSVEIKGIINTIEKSNLIEMKLEKLVGNLFLFIIKRFHYSLEEGDTLPFQNKHVIPLALKIMEKNVKRSESKTESNIEDTHFLNISILVMLINLSAYSNFQNIFDDYEYKETFIKIFLSIAESKQTITNYVPLCLEKCIIGWDINNIKDIISNECIYPYSLISLRLFSHIADILSNEKFPWVSVVYNSSSTDSISYSVTEQLKQYEIDMITQESSIWQDYNSTNKENSKNNIIKENNFKEIFLNSAKHKIQLGIFVNSFKFFLDWLIGQISFGKSDIAEKLNDKYDVNLKNIKNKASNTKLIEMSNFDIVFNLLNKDQPNNLIIARDVSEYIEYVLKTFTNESSDQIFHQADSYLKGDLTSFNMYGTSFEKLKKDPSEETVDNPYLRSLVISSFMRCIYSISQYGSEKEKYMLKKELRVPENFVNFCMLVDTSNYTYCCISNKFLYICDFIFDKISYDANELEMISEVEKLISIFSIIIEKIFEVSYSINKVTKSYNDLIQNLVKCCLTLTKEIQLMSFDLNIKEILIEKVLKKKIVTLLLETLVNVAIRESMDLEIESFINNKMKKGVSKNMNYNIINFNITNLLVIYMSISKDKAYSIIEIINKFTYLKQIKIRKTLINDIIENYKMENLKKQLINSTNNKILFINKCEWINYNESFHNVVFLILSDNEIKLAKYTDTYLIESFNLEKDIVFYEKQTYYLLDVKHLLINELGNRCFIKIKNFYISIFFKKYIHAVEFKKNLVLKCPNLIIHKSNFKFWLDYNPDVKKNKNNNDYNPSNLDNSRINIKIENSVSNSNLSRSDLNLEEKNLNSYDEYLNQNEENDKYNGVINNKTLMTNNDILSISDNRNKKNYGNKNSDKMILELEKKIKMNKNNNILNDFFSSYQTDLFIISFEINRLINFDKLFFGKNQNKLLPNMKLALLSKLCYSDMNSKFNKIKNKDDNYNNDYDEQVKHNNSEYLEDVNKDLFLILFEEDVSNLLNDDLNKSVRENDYCKLKSCYHFSQEFNLKDMVSFNFEAGVSVVFNFSLGSSIKLLFYGDWGYYLFRYRISDYISRCLSIKN